MPAHVDRYERIMKDAKHKQSGKIRKPGAKLEVPNSLTVIPPVPEPCNVAGSSPSR